MKQASVSQDLRTLAGVVAKGVLHSTLVGVNPFILIPYAVRRGNAHRRFNGPVIHHFFFQGYAAPAPRLTRLYWPAINSWEAAGHSMTLNPFPYLRYHWGDVDQSCEAVCQQVRAVVHPGDLLVMGGHSYGGVFAFHLATAVAKCIPHIRLAAYAIAAPLRRTPARELQRYLHERFSWAINFLHDERWDLANLRRRVRRLRDQVPFLTISGRHDRFVPADVVDIGVEHEETDGDHISIMKNHVLASTIERFARKVFRPHFAWAA